MPATVLAMRGLAAAWLVILLAACGGASQPFEIGAHKGTMKVPAGWSVVNQGEKWEVRKGEASIVLHDLGPVSAAAMQREVSRIEALWLGGNAASAQTRARRLSGIAGRFVDESQRRPLQNTMLPLLEFDAARLPEAEAAQRFADWQQAIAALPPATIESWGDAALAVSGHDQRRSIQSRELRTFGGRPAIDYLTVTKSTQQSRKRVVVIDNDGHLLAVYFGILGHEAHLGELDQVVRSLQFAAAASERR
jgi:hypothetical protein